MIHRQSIKKKKIKKKLRIGLSLNHRVLFSGI